MGNQNLVDFHQVWIRYKIIISTFLHCASCFQLSQSVHLKSIIPVSFFLLSTVAFRGKLESDLFTNAFHLFCTSLLVQCLHCLPFTVWYLHCILLLLTPFTPPCALKGKCHFILPHSNNPQFPCLLFTCNCN